MRGPALLFCPGDRPDRYGKAAAAADTVILDLEDAVAPDAKASARESVLASQLDPEATIVRVNPAGTRDGDLDLDAVARTPYRTVMLAKAESPDQLDRFDGYRVVALCETAAGVEAAADLARHPVVHALMWGAEDLVASIGGSSSRRPDGSYRDVARYARSRVLVAAAAAGKPGVDAVHLDIADVDGLRAEAEDAAAVGFQATACIHPSQVAVIRAAYAPTEEAVRWARAVLEAAATEGGVFRFEGRMVDEPVLRHARTLLARVD